MYDVGSYLDAVFSFAAGRIGSYHERSFLE